MALKVVAFQNRPRGDPLTEQAGTKLTFLETVLPIRLANTTSPLEQEIYRFGTALRAAICFAILFHSAMIGLFWAVGLPYLGLFNIGSVVAWIAAGGLLRSQRFSLSQLVGSAEIVAHAWIAVLLLGWSSGFHYYMLVLVPMALFNPQLNGQTKLASVTVIALAYVALYAMSAPVSSEHALLAVYFQYANAVFFIVVLGVHSYYYSWAAKDSGEQVAQAHQQLEYLAETDSLTRLLNRRAVQGRLQELLARPSEPGKGIAVLLADIDFFKQFNDVYGHDCGDHVLKLVACSLQDLLRSQDFAARWGGEEFLSILTDVDSTIAGAVAERIREHIESREFVYAGQAMKITITSGITLHQPGEKIDQTIDRADHALLQGKREGRNQVVMVSG